MPRACGSEGYCPQGAAHESAIECAEGTCVCVGAAVCSVSCCPQGNQSLQSAKYSRHEVIIRVCGLALVGVGVYLFSAMCSRIEWGKCYKQSCNGFWCQYCGWGGDAKHHEDHEDVIDTERSSLNKTPGGIYYYVDGHPLGYSDRERGMGTGEWGVPKKVWIRSAGYTGRDMQESEATSDVTSGYESDGYLIPVVGYNDCSQPHYLGNHIK